ncbi:MAG TPA: hypothetical protein VHA77_16470 [Xanthobacteraceae bacterium]|jgi:hypothetical protein|nr:hypothetical protein [Xanthobacteraceae bacterium]
MRYQPEKRAMPAFHENPLFHEDPLRYDPQAVIRSVGTGLAALYACVGSEPPHDRLTALLRQLDQAAPAMAHSAGRTPDRRG